MIEALVALLTAPFVLFLLALALGASAYVGWLERHRR